MKKLNLISIFKRLIKSPSVINIATVGIITLLIKGLGFFKEIYIVGEFGLSELLDTFYIALLIPGFISEIFLGSFKSVFIPNYISELKSNKNIGAFQSVTFIITLIIAIFFIIISILFTDVFLEYVFPDHTENYYRLIKTQFYYLLPCIIFWSFSSLISGLLNVKNEFRFASFYPVFTSVTVILCLFFFKDILHEKVLAIGMLSGSIIAFIYLVIVALKYDVLHIAKPNFKSNNIREMIKQLPIKVSASLVNGVNPFVDQFFSAQLIIGSITALNYGLKIPAFIISIFGVALGNVLLPYFSNISYDDRAIAYKKLKEIIKYAFWICVIIMTGLFIFSSPIVSLFYERDAFTSSDSIIVSKIQQMYLLQIPFYVIGLVMIKYLTAINRNSFMVYASIISLVLNLVLNLLLIEQLGVFGLALSTSIVSAINTIILYIYIVKLNAVKAHV